MANIVLKDVSGNNIYPEIDASTLSGTITENASGFVIGGDVYTALDNVSANAKDIYPVNATYGASVTLDKTYDEIYSAVNSNKLPIIYFTNYDNRIKYTFTFGGGSYKAPLYFTSNYITNPYPNENALYSYSLELLSNNTVTISQTILNQTRLDGVYNTVNSNSASWGGGTEYAAGTGIAFTAGTGANSGKTIIEVDSSALSGNIAENNEKFVIGGDVYSALSGKADKSDIKPQVHASWIETDFSEPSFIVGKPYIHQNVTYSDEINDTSSGNYNTHTIDSTDKNNGYFYLALPLATVQNAGIVRLLGDIFGFRGICGGSATSMSSDYISSIDIILGDENKDPIIFKMVGYNQVPIIIRRIDASEFSKSDVNVETDTTGETRFHFMHFGACRANMEYLTIDAHYLLIKVNMATNTRFAAGDKFCAYVSFTQF